MSISINLRSKVSTIARNIYDAEPTKAICANDERVCPICLANRSSYTCPKCFQRYCSSKCYKDHSNECSEQFAKARATNVIELEKKAGVVSMGPEAQKLADRQYNRRNEAEFDDPESNEELVDVRNNNNSNNSDDSDDSDDESNDCVDEPSSLSKEMLELMERLQSTDFDISSLSVTDKEQLKALMKHNPINKHQIKECRPWWLGGPHPYFGSSMLENSIFHGISESRRCVQFVDIIYNNMIPVITSKVLTPNPLIRFQIFSLLISYVVSVRCFPLTNFDDNKFDNDTIISQSQVILELSNLLDTNFKPCTISHCMETFIRSSMLSQNISNNNLNRNGIQSILEDVSYLMTTPEMFCFAIIDCWCVLFHSLQFIEGSIVSESSIETIQTMKIAELLRNFNERFLSKLRPGLHSKSQVTVEQLTRKVYFLLLCVLNQSFDLSNCLHNSEIQQTLFHEIVAYMKECGYHNDD